VFDFLHSTNDVLKERGIELRESSFTSKHRLYGNDELHRFGLKDASS
jgi:hypothetical protein